MLKQLIRFYDENDTNSLQGKRHFLVLEKKYDDLTYDEFDTIFFSVTGMKWQKYNSYMVGVAEIEENELYWSEIMNYEMHEVCIECDRLENNRYFNFPLQYQWWRDENPYLKHNDEKPYLNLK